MSHFSKSIFVSAAFCLALSTFAFTTRAQDATNDQAAAQAQDIPQPSAGIQISQSDVQTQLASPPAAAEPMPAPATETVAPTPQTTVVKPIAAKHAKAAKHAAKKKAHKKAKAAANAKMNAKEHIRIAQANLEELGYSPGKADGISGRKTKTALKGFQNDHHLKPTGTLTNETFDLLAQVVMAKRQMTQQQMVEVPQTPPTPEFFTKHADFYGYYGADYSNPMQFGSPQPIPTRFGDMQIADQQMEGGMHQYVITLNGQPVFHAAGQPAVINVSRTFNLDNADVIVLTSYAGNADNTCPYRHYVMVVRVNSNGVHEIGNCTRTFEAYTENNSLFIAFPEGHINGWASGDMWRYEHGTLQRL